MEGWKEERLNDFAWFQRGYDLPKAKFEEGKVPVYGSTSVLGYHNKSKVKAPGVITGRSGTLGVLQFAKEDFWPHNTSLWVKNFKGNNEKFAYYLFKCLDFSLFNSGGAVPTLNRNVLNSFIVNVPPLPTQRKIASILSAYDDLIENNMKRIKLLEEKAQLTYEEWFVRMKFPGHETAVMNEETGLPEGWARGKISDLFELQRGFDLPKQKRKCGLIPIIASKGIVDYHNIEKVKGPGVVTGRSGTIGEVQFVLNDFWPLNTTLWIKKYNNANPTYALQFLRKIKLKRFAGGSAVPSLDRKVIHHQSIRVPSKELINKYGNYSKPILMLIEKFYSQNQILKEARDILLPRLMTGMIDTDKISVHDAKEITN